ncbi:CLUMA_CG009687, isoform A [Clunio marinus]|uniref:CLUMA_CG009687, isoform A n=1 Tax=Clunio marinus TaxID=568069 RepID=A0A1J1IBA8_9DIPT|nr:CLUMA_CG009687, isoform A [Clunio marinus]
MSSKSFSFKCVDASHLVLLLLCTFPKRFLILLFKSEDGRIPKMMPKKNLMSINQVVCYKLVFHVVKS